MFDCLTWLQTCEAVKTESGADSSWTRYYCLRWKRSRSLCLRGFSLPKSKDTKCKSQAVVCLNHSFALTMIRSVSPRETREKLGKPPSHPIYFSSILKNIPIKPPVLHHSTRAEHQQPPATQKTSAGKASFGAQLAHEKRPAEVTGAGQLRQKIWCFLMHVIIYIYEVFKVDNLL